MEENQFYVWQLSLEGLQVDKSTQLKLHSGEILFYSVAMWRIFN